MVFPDLSRRAPAHNSCASQPQSQLSRRTNKEHVFLLAQRAILAFGDTRMPPNLRELRNDGASKPSFVALFLPPTLPIYSTAGRQALLEVLSN
jgi:hypothetical protein